MTENEIFLRFVLSNLKRQISINQALIILNAFGLRFNDYTVYREETIHAQKQDNPGN